MSIIKDLQEALPFFVNIPPLPKAVFSLVLVLIVAFLLLLIWTPAPAPADTAAKEILERCYKRALFTRMHAQLNTDAMYASIDQCRKEVQSRIPALKSEESRAVAVELLSILEVIGTFAGRPPAYEDAGKINDLKRAALGQFRKLADLVGATYVLPEPGTLGEAIYFTAVEAGAPPSLAELKSALK